MPNRRAVEDQVMGDVCPLGDVGRLAVLADVHVRRAVPRVDRAMVLRLSHPVEEQVVLDRVAVAERIVQIDLATTAPFTVSKKNEQRGRGKDRAHPGTGAVVRHVAAEGGAAGGGGEQSARLLARHADLMKVVACDAGLQRVLVRRLNGSQHTQW